ncbi:insulin-like growth factor-binding protein complex acid labile subunit [Centruroides sculpturatus]|uniref:insulin-like growth factor-binding protein complex acid labile subunit n=1 Tax=Centruroides sculpturatus TaxID=218467 RepID=UPI000C6D9208|nr:insulin-like growth factor-binding protein complex acid labile subunit [Centruroides sculpturatus]
MHFSEKIPSAFIFILHISTLWRDVTALCPLRCKCDDDNLRVICDSSSLDVVPITLNPELRELHLSNNHIKGIMASFAVYRKLDYLDMSHNQLVTLGRNNFELQRHLKVLLLHRNMISSLQNETFRGLLSLEVLHLNENFLEEIPSGVFAPLSRLEKLDLSQNRISRITDHAFHGLKNLKTLLLRDNKLGVVPTQSFYKLESLLKLDLGLNSFRTLPETSFISLNNLEELILDGCGIRALDKGALKWLNSLLVLRLHDNELSDIPTDCLSEAVRLEELHFGQNPFKILKPFSFRGLRYLRKIEANGAQLFERIETQAFADNVNLERAIFNHNKNLKIIDHGAFDGLPNLRHLSFRGNAFRTFDSRLLAWDELEYFDVRDNPLTCNCSLLWLWNLLHTKNFTDRFKADSSRILCLAPEEVRGKILTEVTVDGLGCYDVEARRRLLIGIVAAAAVAGACLVMLAIRCRDRVAGLLKNKWNGGRKEPQYQKTNGEEETTVLPSGQLPLKLTPVTEL